MKAYKDLSERIYKIIDSLKEGKITTESVKQAHDQIMALLQEYDYAVQTTRNALVRDYIGEIAGSGKVSTLLEKLENVMAFHKVEEDDRKG